MSNIKPALSVFAATSLLTLGWAAMSSGASNSVNITVKGDTRCVISNGVPNHAIGQFPNRGNPHRFRAQRVKLCMDATPTKTGKATFAPASGVTVTGIVIRPGTADYYDPSSPRGHSRDRSSGWNLEGMGSADTLGIDANKAHVDHRGLYHYHGMPTALINIGGSTLMGYAADGHEIHYVGGQAKPSYVLKAGNRPSGPGGRHDGTFVEDWQYAKGAGNLDRCNGGTINGKYVYFATATYPFFPRCFWGTVSRDFKRP
ncbi:MAG: YHYH protein [Pseudomonadota bacterium]